MVWVVWTTAVLVTTKVVLVMTRMVLVMMLMATVRRWNDVMKHSLVSAMELCARAKSAPHQLIGSASVLVAVCQRSLFIPDAACGCLALRVSACQCHQCVPVAVSAFASMPAAYVLVPLSYNITASPDPFLTPPILPNPPPPLVLAPPHKHLQASAGRVHRHGVRRL